MGGRRVRQAQRRGWLQSSHVDDAVSQQRTLNAPYIEVSTSSPLTETATMKQAAWFRATSDLCSARISVPASFTPEWLLSDDGTCIMDYYRSFDAVEPIMGCARKVRDSRVDVWQEWGDPRVKGQLVSWTGMRSMVRKTTPFVFFWVFLFYSILIALT